MYRNFSPSKLEYQATISLAKTVQREDQLCLSMELNDMDRLRSVVILKLNMNKIQPMKTSS